VPLAADISKEDIIMREINIQVIIVIDKLIPRDVALWGVEQ